MHRAIAAGRCAACLKLLTRFWPWQRRWGRLGMNDDIEGSVLAPWRWHVDGQCVFSGRSSVNRLRFAFAGDSFERLRGWRAAFPHLSSLSERRRQRSRPDRGITPRAAR